MLFTDDADNITVGAAVGAAVGLVVLVTCSVVLVVWLVRLVKRKQGLLTRIHTVVYMATLTHTCMHTLFLCVYAHTGDVPSSSVDMRSFERVCVYTPVVLVQLQLLTFGFVHYLSPLCIQ